VYQLLGGKCREAADLYTGVGGVDNAQLIENIRKAKAAGYPHFRLNLGAGGGDGGATADGRGLEVLHSAPLWDREAYLRNLLKMLEAVRTALGDEIEIIHDVHEKIMPTEAFAIVQRRREVPAVFLEDPLSPEDNAYYRIIRQQSTTPIAKGELFNNPHEMDSAHYGAADRLHPGACITSGRPDAGAQNRDPR
jgi:mannonate dehydratase